MQSPGQGRGQKRFVEGRRREEIEDSCVGYYALVVADSIACCFAELHEQLTSDERAWEVQPPSSRRPSSFFKRRRKSSVPISKFNPSVIYEQPTRPGQLRKPPKLAGHVRPVSQNLQHQPHSAQNESAPKTDRRSRHLDNKYQDVEPIRISLANPYTRALPPPPPPPPPPRDVMSDPNALINRPKSAYTRNRRTDDEEPVFWQHSDRTTKRFRQSQYSTLRPRSLIISKQQEESRRSNASTFENLLNRTFSSQPLLNLQNIQPNPIINVYPPSTPSLPPTPVEGDQSSQQKTLPSPPDFEFSSPQETPNQRRISRFQDTPSQKRFSGTQEHKRISTLQDQPNHKRFSSSQETPKSKRYSGFRPLQLSFYLPGNRLSLLPHFSDDDDVESEIPPVPEVSRPVTALMKAKPSVISDRPSTFHSIPRKAVGSQATSIAGGSNRSSVQSSVTLNAGMCSRSSMLQDAPRSDGRLSTSTWRNTQDFQKPADKALPSPARPVSRIWADIVERPSSQRKSGQSVQLETQFEEPPSQPEFNCTTINEECSPVSPVSSVSPVSPLSPASPTPIKHHSAVDYHDYEFVTPAPQIAKHRSAVEYHDYEFTTPTLTPQTPAFSNAALRDSTMKVAPLFHGSTVSSSSSSAAASAPSDNDADTDDNDDDELPENSKPRSSSGSSTLYHGESSSPTSDTSELPAAVKRALSVAFPSPTIQHRLSDWLSRSATHHHQQGVQSWSPPKGGEVYGQPDSPTLGFSWKDFGWSAEKGEEEDEEEDEEGEKGERKRRPFTVGGEALGAEEFDLEKFPVPRGARQSLGVGVAY